MDPLLLALGSLISILLTVNAHFTRKTLEKISSVELKLAVWIERHDATDERARQNTKEIDRLKDEMVRENQRNRERLHKLEGGQVRVLSYLQEIKD